MAGPFVVVAGILACGPRVPGGAPQPPSGARLNWSDPVHGTIYRGTAQTCYVQLPFPKPPTAVVPPPTAPVPCPSAMLEPVWDGCVGGVIDRFGAECRCQWSGNPPPPPQTVTCPE